MTAAIMLERPIEVSDFVDATVLRLSAQSLGRDLSLLLRVEDDGPAGGVAAIGYVAACFPDDAKARPARFLDVADGVFETSLAAAVAELVAVETNGGVSMCCQAFPAGLDEAARAQMKEISLVMARNLLSKIRLRQGTR